MYALTKDAWVPQKMSYLHNHLWIEKYSFDPDRQILERDRTELKDEELNSAEFFFSNLNKILIKLCEN